MRSLIRRSRGNGLAIVYAVFFTLHLEHWWTHKQQRRGKRQTEKIRRKKMQWIVQLRTNDINWSSYAQTCLSLRWLTARVENQLNYLLYTKVKTICSSLPKNTFCPKFNNKEENSVFYHIKSSRIDNDTTAMLANSRKKCIQSALSLYCTLAAFKNDT